MEGGRYVSLRLSHTDIHSSLLFFFLLKYALLYFVTGNATTHVFDILHTPTSTTVYSLEDF